MAIGSAAHVRSQSGRESLEVGTDSFKWVLVPHLGIPSLEPASESWRLGSLFDGGDGQPTATAGV